MQKWKLTPETYTRRRCRYRVGELLAIEDWDRNGQKPLFKPKWAWSSGADKLFYEADRNNYMSFG